VISFSQRSDRGSHRSFVIYIEKTPVAAPFEEVLQTSNVPAAQRAWSDRCSESRNGLRIIPQRCNG
jgi:hypothetical protein